MAVPEFHNRIDLGTIIQGGVLLVTVLGGIVGTYMTMEGRINIQSERITILQQQMTELLRQNQHTQEEQKAFVRDVGQSLTKLTDQMTELRVIIGAKHR